MIIVCGGVKGGCGKTSLATNLAVMRQSDGSRVALVDADEQRSAYEFVQQRAGLNNGVLPCHTPVGRDTLVAVRELAEEFDDIIVDVGGRDTAAQRAALIAADLVIVPFTPGNYDAWTIVQVENLVTEILKVNPKLEAVSVINRAYPRGRDNAEAADLLRCSEVMRYLDMPLMDRKSVVRSSGDGLAVFEYKPLDTKAIAEFQRLYGAVFGAVQAEAAA